MASALAATPDDKKSKVAVRATVATEGAAPESPAGAPAGMPIFLEAGFANPVAQSPAAGSESGGASRPWRGLKEDSDERGEARFQGQTSWQMSQPKTWRPIPSIKLGLMAPRCSMVR